MKLNKQRVQIVLFLVLIIPLGFYTKFYSGPAQAWVNDSLGGVFYEIFWILFAAFFLLNIRALKISFWVFMLTCLLEFLQLWHPPFLSVLRGTFIGRTILGTSFNWMDFPYYLIGSICGFYLLLKIRKR